jgi:hypothetical protein
VKRAQADRRPTASPEGGDTCPHGGPTGTEPGR